MMSLPGIWVLTRWGADDEALEALVDPDLAAEAAVRLDVKGEVEHLLLEFLGRRQALIPARLDIDVAGRAGAGAAAVALNARNGEAFGAVHHRNPVWRIDMMLSAARLEVGDLGHAILAARERAGRTVIVTRSSTLI
jgi:hypothetical protein